MTASVYARRFGLAFLLLAAALGTIVLGARVQAAAPAPAAHAVTVTIKNFAFAPQVITVTPGTTVTWTNADEDPHTATATDKSFHSAALDTGGHYSFTFTHPGDFAYFCAMHPHMTGHVIVKG